LVFNVFYSKLCIKKEGLSKLELGRLYIRQNIFKKIIIFFIFTKIYYWIKLYIKIEVLIARGGQCGGIGYNGSKTCESGLKCFIQNYIQSFCYESCPENKYWQCEGNGKYIIWHFT